MKVDLSKFQFKKKGADKKEEPKDKDGKPNFVSAKKKKFLDKMKEKC